MQNIRQKEMRERMNRMIQFVCYGYIESRLKEKPNQNPYIEGIFKEYFLAKYRVHEGVGTFASLRYFNDFVKCGYFEDKGEVFYVVYEEIRHNPYGIKFPEPRIK